MRTAKRRGGKILYKSFPNPNPKHSSCLYFRNKQQKQSLSLSNHFYQVENSVLWFCSNRRQSNDNGILYHPPENPNPAIPSELPPPFRPSFSPFHFPSFRIRSVGFELCAACMSSCSRFEQRRPKPNKRSCCYCKSHILTNIPYPTEKYDVVK